MDQNTKDRLLVLPQYVVPQHLLSRAIGLLADSEAPGIRNTFIKTFMSLYPINMREALQEDPLAYRSFNDFFTRALKPDARPITDQGIACPADGAISEIGPIDDDRVFQAKGHHYTLRQLLGGDAARAEPFRNGQFATVYLSPRDYHRVHMPYSGTLREMIYVPGKLFSVNQRTAQQVPALFARNERVVCLFDTDLGPMAVILVGAMIVASIETAWAGLVAPPRRRLQVERYGTTRGEEIRLQRGDELGRFRLGSTAIVLLPKGKSAWRPDLKAGSAVRMGESIATLA